MSEQTKTEDVVKRVREALMDKTPFLLTRLGDGEDLAMRSVGVHDTGAIENLPWNKHLGYVPTDADKQQWQDLSLASISDSDLLGLHPVDSTQGMEFRRSGNSLRLRLGDAIKEECSANIHLDIMRDRLHQMLAEPAQGVWLMTGHPIARGFRSDIWKGKNPKLVKWFILPLQNRYFGQKTSWESWTDGILPDIKKLPEMRGWLVLFGGGIPGKAMLGALKERGGVVVDIGSVFDHWAGFLTRGKGKGRGKLNTAWKLGKEGK